MSNNMELEFQKLSLKSDDILVIKVKSEGLDANDVIETMSTVRSDEFVQFIQNKGNPVLVVNDTIKFEILRKENDDKVLVYLDVSTMTDEESEQYQEYIKFKLNESLGDKLICVPVKTNTAIKIDKEVKSVN